MALTRTKPEQHPEITAQTLVIFPIDENLIDTEQLSETDREYLESYNHHLQTPGKPDKDEKEK